MPRRRADITINIHFHWLGEKHKVELTRGLWGRWWVKFDRRNSLKIREGSLTEVCGRLRTLLVRKARQEPRV